MFLSSLMFLVSVDSHRFVQRGSGTDYVLSFLCDPSGPRHHHPPSLPIRQLTVETVGIVYRDARVSLLRFPFFFVFVVSYLVLF